MDYPNRFSTKYTGYIPYAFESVRATSYEDKLIPLDQVMESNLTTNSKNVIL
jgi:hypothetical protein